MSNNKKTHTSEERGMGVIIGVLIAVIAVIVVVGVILAVNLFSDAPVETDGNAVGTSHTATEGTAVPETVAGLSEEMEAIQDEIDSRKISDFTETNEVTEYVKITVRNHGDIILRLRSDIAPITVKNFQDLVSESFYDGVIFHRIMKGFMMQGGDGRGGSDNTIKGEFEQNGVENHLAHIKGVISMARTTDPNSATSQFFICNADARGSLDRKYAGFGYVVAGLATVDSISNVQVTYNSSGELSKPVEQVIMDKVCFVKLNAPEETTEATTTEAATTETAAS